MKTTALIFLLGFSVLAVGCGPSKAEREAAERERQRLELERQAEAERRAANEAFRKIGDKLGRKAPGTTFAKPTDSSAAASTEPHAPAAEAMPPADQSKEQ